MRAVVIGTSGSGKSTLAQRLGKLYGAAVLHLDAVHFLPGWVERPVGEEREIVGRFLDEHGSWVIDGSYGDVCFERRLEEADLILVLWFNRFVCLRRVVSRWLRNRGRSRDSMAEGCEEKMDAGFVWWVLHKGRTASKRKTFLGIGERYPGKLVWIGNQRQLDAYLASIGDGTPRR